MTDYSVWTDEQVNEAIAQRIWAHTLMTFKQWDDILARSDYTHDWRLCGELLTEMSDAILDGWELSCEHSDMDGTEPMKWRVWMTRFTNDPADFRSFHGEADTFIRALDNCWLAWKEQG